MDEHDWLASNSGPRGCPMEIIDGDFSFPGERGSLYIPRAKVHAGWGRAVSLDVVGDERKPLPDSLTVLFFSYLENRFYRAAFPLPRDSVARLFRDGYRSFEAPSGRGTFNRIIAGVAPGGAVAVWVSGAERQVEVFFGQAEPANIDWHKAMEAPPEVDRGAFVADELAGSAKADPLVRSMQEQIPVGRWAAYRTRYRWRAVFEGLDAPDRLERVEFVNGERAYVPLPLDTATARTGLPVPSLLPFEDPRTSRYYRPRLDEEEASAAFARLGAGGQPVDLVFSAPRDAGTQLQVHVRSAAGTVALQRVRFE